MSQILVADDDPGIIGLLKLLVEREGYLVDVARDGQEAVEKIQSGSYVLMLLDLQMPRFNGFDVIDFLAKQPKRPVVLVITALTAPQVSKLDPTVVHAVIRKPFDVELLASIISSTAGMMHRGTVVFDHRRDQAGQPN